MPSPWFGVLYQLFKIQCLLLWFIVLTNHFKFSTSPHGLVSSINHLKFSASSYGLLSSQTTLNSVPPLMVWCPPPTILKPLQIQCLPPWFGVLTNHLKFSTSPHGLVSSINHLKFSAFSYGLLSSQTTTISASADYLYYNTSTIPI